MKDIKCENNIGLDHLQAAHSINTPSFNSNYFIIIDQNTFECFAYIVATLVNTIIIIIMNCNLVTSGALPRTSTGSTSMSTSKKRMTSTLSSKKRVEHTTQEHPLHPKGALHLNSGDAYQHLSSSLSSRTLTEDITVSTPLLSLLSSTLSFTSSSHHAAPQKTIPTARCTSSSPPSSWSSASAATLKMTTSYRSPTPSIASSLSTSPTTFSATTSSWPSTPTSTSRTLLRSSSTYWSTSNQLLHHQHRHRNRQHQ